jgi:spore coat protein CotF
MSNWLDKAKEAALNAAETAKKTAQNANLGEMLDKTKAVAMQVAEEAKNAASTVMTRNKEESTDAAAGAPEAAEPNCNSTFVSQCNTKIAQIEKLLQELKSLLSKQS